MAKLELKEVKIERKHPLAICEKCPFQDRAFAATTGPKDAKVAVVSRSPGHMEAMQASRLQVCRAVF